MLPVIKVQTNTKTLLTSTERIFQQNYKITILKNTETSTQDNNYQD